MTKSSIPDDDGGAPWLAGTDAGDLAASAAVTPASRFGQLPAELRLKVWRCAVEPRVVPLNDLVHRPLSYRLPGVTQVNAEARYESRKGYERVGQDGGNGGPYFDFANDILLCDYAFENETEARSVLETVAPRVQRAVFWDCIPDDRVCGPDEYAEYLRFFYRQSRFGEVLFSEMWFPNVRELWLVKVADVDERWGVRPPPPPRSRGKSTAATRSSSFSSSSSTSTSSSSTALLRERLAHMAREFRYWVDAGVIEMAPLDWSAADTRLVLGEGTCARGDCRTLNRCRERIVSKVNFLDGPYRNSKDVDEDEVDKDDKGDGREWVRIEPPGMTTRTATATSQGGSGKPGEEDRSARQNRLRWLLVERTLTLLLRCDWPTADDGEILVRRGKH